MSKFFADLHIHSHYSRATSRDLKPAGIASWAMRKGIDVVGTGDCTHPQWRKELRENLQEDGRGLYRLKDDIKKEIERLLPSSCRRDIKFMITGEISTIYKKGDKTRKVHHVVCFPSLEAADDFANKLSKIGNIVSDGRPILGLDSRHLLEMVLETGEGAFLIPAHIWTPWFSVLGSKSGFDSIEECYGDLATHIFAVETGLSSDPEMNWMVSKLDRYRLVSNSDAHSPSKLGREACIFDCERSFYAIRKALETGEGYVGTVEFFPEEGKYHLDGHRKCGVCLEPHETKKLGGICPVCGKPLTVGVMYRVYELSDRERGNKPDTAGSVLSLVPLVEIVSELVGKGAQSKTVKETFDILLSRLGPELMLLSELDLEEIKLAHPLLNEAISRLRRGKVIRKGGFDGEYGVIRLFDEDEMREIKRGGALFKDLLPKKKKKSKSMAEGQVDKLIKARKKKVKIKNKASSIGLDSNQQKAVKNIYGPLLINAGPGSGKTRTITERIANIINTTQTSPSSCLAVTFTRRAAAEMKDRLEKLIPSQGDNVLVHTFHSLGLEILRNHYLNVELPSDFRVIDEASKISRISAEFSVSPRQAYGLARGISLYRRSGKLRDPKIPAFAEKYEKSLREDGFVDFDDLVILPVRILESDAEIKDLWSKKFTFISVDEYQDIEPIQYKLVKLLASNHDNICVVGDPNQSIYGFRGADPAFFKKFIDDFPNTCLIKLNTNYRCSSAVNSLAEYIIGNAFSKGRGKDNIKLYKGISEAAEAEYIVMRIEEIVGGHNFFSIDSGRSEGRDESDLSFSDIGILYRTEAQSSVIAEALNRAGIPFSKYSHKLLCEMSGVKEMLEAVASAPEEDGILDVLEREEDKVSLGPDYASHSRIMNMLLEIARKCNYDRTAFIDNVMLSSEVDFMDPRAERVSLLTMHAAKGLEFNTVFIAGCEDGIIPLYWDRSPDPEETAEERRLFYVAVTRAEKRLFMSYAEKRMWMGKTLERTLTPFLKGAESLYKIDIGRRYRRRPESKQLSLIS